MGEAVKASPNLLKQIETVKELGYELVAKDYQETIKKTIQRGGDLGDIEKEIQTALNAILANHENK